MGRPQSNLTKSGSVFGNLQDPIGFIGTCGSFGCNPPGEGGHQPPTFPKPPGVQNLLMLGGTSESGGSHGPWEPL